jgi:predicted transcriptional regulator
MIPIWYQKGAINMNKRSFTLRLPTDLDKALKELAQANNQTKSQIIRDAIKFHLDQNTKRGDRHE